MNPRAAKFMAILIALLAMPLAISLASDAAGKPANSGTTADETAIKQVVAGFSDGWNSHDAPSYRQKKCLDLPHSAVNVDFHSRDVRCIRRCEERYRARNLFRLAESLHRYFRNDAFRKLFKRRLGQPGAAEDRCFDRPRADRIHANAPAS